MRYFKGIIALSPTQDLPLLRQVMYSKYVTQTQLWQFMRHSGYELSRGSFWWRVKRLVDHGFITGHLLPMVHRDPIFAIASCGLVYLVENIGTPYSGPDAGPDVRVDGVGVAHALGVNAVHLDLLRNRALVSWENETEIRCRNELAAGRYAKDYDAIVTLALGGRQLRFALEYERTPKTQTEYGRIVSLLESERNLDRVLYLAGTRQIHSLLKQRLWRIRQRVLIGLVRNDDSVWRAVACIRSPGCGDDWGNVQTVCAVSSLFDVSQRNGPLADAGGLRSRIMETWQRPVRQIVKST